MTILNAINSLSSSDEQLKYWLYNDYKMSRYLREIIYQGNEYEKECAIYSLWNFCFDRRVAIHFRSDTELVDYLVKLENQHSIADDDALISNLKSYSSGVLFQSKLLSTNVRLDLSGSKVESDKIRLVSASGHDLALVNLVETCLKDSLFRLSNASRIDEDNLGCVVVFLTSSLKYCAESRSRIEFALALKKPIFCILAENGFIYEAHGW